MKEGIEKKKICILCIYKNEIQICLLKLRKGASNSDTSINSIGI